MSKKYIEIGLVTLVTAGTLFLILIWTIQPLIHSRKEVLVPELTGKSLKDAVDIVSSLGLGISKEAEEFNSQLPPQSVIRQSPSGGMTVREGKIVKVTLSKGSDLVFVPEIIGQSVKIAELTIRRNQLAIRTKTQVYSLKFSKDTVVSQTPSAGSIVEKNTPVDFTISLGAPPEGIILMPDFVGKNITEATNWLSRENLNFELKEEISETTPTTPTDIVLGQSPQPDTVLTGEVPIEITVSRTKATLVGEIFSYEIPRGTKEQNVRLVLIDEFGEREIYSGVQPAGAKLQLPISKKGKAKIRVFINNILVEEKEL
ncbi:MAG: PASTA domain-containing protein [Elusimicrobiota bacterium]|nr:PASTA domain-containing protein [Elusimicrobiota bacterium]